MEPVHNNPRPPGNNRKWWQSDDAGNNKPCAPGPKEGFPCPACLLGELYYNGLFQLICDNCGRVAEAAVFT